MPAPEFIFTFGATFEALGPHRFCPAHKPSYLSNNIIFALLCLRQVGAVSVSLLYFHWDTFAPKPGHNEDIFGEVGVTFESATKDDIVQDDKHSKFADSERHSSTDVTNIERNYRRLLQRFSVILITQIDGRVQKAKNCLRYQYVQVVVVKRSNHEDASVNPYNE